MPRNFPCLCLWATDIAANRLLEATWGPLDLAWRLTLPSSSEVITPALRAGTLTSVAGVVRFEGPRALAVEDGSVLDAVDAVVCATGYAADLDVAPFLETGMPRRAADYDGPPLVRLWMNMFPPTYADSIVMLYHSAFGKSNGFSFCDVRSMAVSNIWRGVHPLPSLQEREAQVDDHNEWLASWWRLEHNIDVFMVRQWIFQGFLHEAAGTGMYNLGWGWKDWKFWFKDPKMYHLMSHGVETAHAFRFFETGKRKTWSEAREAIIHMNELVKLFPIKEKSQ
jgi:dimethylaniline monooxygenase (N-oxide forming)